MKMIPANFILLFLLFIKNSSSKECNETMLYHVRLDRPGLAGRLQICWEHRSYERPIYKWTSICKNNIGKIVSSACSELGYHKGEKIYFSQDESSTLFCNTIKTTVQGLQQCRSYGYMYRCSQTLGVICESTVRVNSETIMPSTVAGIKSDQGTALGGALGVVIGILIIVAVALLIGLIYFRNKANSHRKEVKKNTNCHLDNPVYAAPSPPPASVNHQQTTTQSQDHSEMNGNHYHIEDDRDYHVLEDRDYHELEDPAQSKQHVPVINYGGFREDSVSVQSYEVPVSQSQENDRK